jgi:hypothetical protein
MLGRHYGKITKCSHCGESVGEKPVVWSPADETYLFCTPECRDTFQKKDGVMVGKQTTFFDTATFNGS